MRIRESHLIALLTFVQFVHMADFVIMMPLGPMLMRSFGIGTSEFSYMVSAYTFAAALSGILAGFIIDRFDRRPVLLALLAGLGAATLACAWAPSYAWMVVIRAAAGTFGGVLAAFVMAVVADAIPPERRGRAYGIVMASFALASILGIPIGMMLATAHSWHTPFIAFGAAALAAGIWAAIVFPSMRGHLTAQAATPVQVIRTIFGSALHWRAFALTTALAFGGFTVIPFISPALVGNVGFTDDQLKYVYLIGGIATVVTSPLIGRLSDRFTPVLMFTLIAAVSVVPILVLTQLGAVGMVIALVVTTCFIIFVSGRFVPSSTLVADSIDPRWRGSFMSFNSAIMSGASGAASLVAGAIVIKAADGKLMHFERVGVLAVICTIAAIAIAQWIHRTKPQPVSAPQPAQ